MDAQSVKTVEESAPHQRLRRPQARQGAEAAYARGHAGPADLDLGHAREHHDKVGAWRLLAGLKPLVPRLEKIWADGAYTSKKLARWCKGYGGWDLEIVGRDPEAQGFAVQPRRWVVEGAEVSPGWCATAACGLTMSGRCRRARH